MNDSSGPDSAQSDLSSVSPDPPLPTSLKGLRLLLVLFAGIGPPLAYGYMGDHNLPFFDSRIPWSMVALMWFAPIYLVCAVRLKGASQRLWRFLVVVLVLSLMAPELAELLYGYFSRVEMDRELYEVAAAPVLALLVISFYGLNRSAQLYFDLNTRPDDVPEAYLRKAES